MALIVAKDSPAGVLVIIDGYVKISYLIGKIF